MENDVQVNDLPAETTAPEQIDTAAQDAPAARPDSAPDKVQRRINRLVAERGHAQGQLDAALQRIAELEARSQQQQPATQRQEGPPKASDFQDFDAYLEAKAKHIASQTFAENARKQQEAWYAAQANQAQQVLMSTWNQRLAQARVEIPDLDEAVMSADAPISPVATRAIMASEMGPAVLYHLAKTPADVAKLNTLSPEAAFLFVGRIETKIEAARKGQSSANQPLAPVSGSGNPASAPSDSDDMEAWIKKRTKQLRR